MITDTFKTLHGRREDVVATSSVKTLRKAREVEAEMAPTENKRKQIPKTLQSGDAKESKRNSTRSEELG